MSSNKMQPIDVAERNKMMKLKTESSDPNLKNKVEWLYTGDKIDRDAYLLGKPIDKLLIEKEINKPQENDIKISTIDLANKIREDPLFEIKKQEIEAKKRLLENPLKMKQLKQMISKSNDESDEDDHRRNKKHKKKKNKKKKKKHHKEHSDKSSNSSDSEDDGSKKSRQNYDLKYEKQQRRSSRSRSRNRDSSSYRPAYGLVKRKHSRSRSKSRSRSHERDNKGKHHKTKAQLEIEEYKNRIGKLKEIRSGGGSSYERRAGNGSTSTSKMSDEERKKRLEEMQQNAEWRNEVRNKNVNKYRADDRREEELEAINNSRQNQEKASTLFNNIMKDAYISAEDRIKRNIKNIQRNESAYDRNFARK